VDKGSALCSTTIAFKDFLVNPNQHNFKSSLSERGLFCGYLKGMSLLFVLFVLLLLFLFVRSFGLFVFVCSFGLFVFVCLLFIFLVFSF
jgi:hypothetical protein